MSVDRRPKRKTASKRESAAPKKPPKKKRSGSPTADNLEALLNLLDDEANVDAGLVAARKTRKPAAGRTPKPPKEPSAGEASSFIQELARARAELHREHRSRIVLEGQTESLRGEIARLTANEAAETDTLRRDCAELRRQLAALEMQRNKLHDARLDLESQLETEQRQREQLNDQLDATDRQLAAERSRRETIAADLEASRREIERRTIEADAARAAWESAGDELRSELATMTSRCEQTLQARDAAQAAVDEQQSNVAALTERIADTETKLSERDELIRQARSTADECARSAAEWEEQFQHEQATRARIEQQYSDHVKEHGTMTAALASRVEMLHSEVASLNEQLSDASSKLAASSADVQKLRTELTDAEDENQKSAMTLEEMAAVKEQLERRLHELEMEHAASNEQFAKRENDSTVVNERIERLETTVAKARIDLAKAYEQLGTARLSLANTNRDREQAQLREVGAVRRANELAGEVTSLKDAVQREAAARRKAEAVHKREASGDEASALFEAEQRIERLSAELAASKGVEAAYQQKAARKVQQVKQELETLRQRLAEIEQRPTGS